MLNETIEYLQSGRTQFQNICRFRKKCFYSFIIKRKFLELKFLYTEENTVIHFLYRMKKIKFSICPEYLKNSDVNWNSNNNYTEIIGFVHLIQTKTKLFP